ncbi:MAG: hypothetical protein L6Q40_12545 [Azonexus sp.]|nr:hypothetical protein [Azonexus sp.]
MLKTAAVTLLAVLAAAGLALGGRMTPAALAHLVFAIGVVPLIFAAMTHFVPVLTRTGDPGGRIAFLPPLAQLTGGFVVAGMAGWLPYHTVHAGAAVDLALAAILLHWIHGRAHACLGQPHPGWRWYAAALLMLMTALLAVVGMALLPAHWHALRGFHLHLNTLGLVGLAAFGTLPLLLPTALGKPDPDVFPWMIRRLPPMAIGALALAAGVAAFWPMSVAAAAVLFVTVLGLAGQWLRRFGLRCLLADGVTASLLAAVIGWLLCLSAGVVHAAGLTAARPTLLAWGVAFLLPLISGALSQLLPVWRWPGPRCPERDQMRSRLAASGRLRSGLWLAAGLAFLCGIGEIGIPCTAAAMLLFAFALVQAMRIRRSTR